MSKDPRVAVVITSINVPEVLRLYHQFDRTAGIFVIGDDKTPGQQTLDLVRSLGPNAYFHSAEYQKEMSAWRCHKLIPFNTYDRKNLGYLEALKWGADIIVSIDDDCSPIEPAFFDILISRLMHPFDGMEVHGFNDWWDPGSLLVPPTPQRGMPPTRRLTTWSTRPITNAKVGVCQALTLGDADVDAEYRLAHRPCIGRTSVLGSAGVVVDPNTKTVFNSQATAWVRELTPLMFLLPGTGRFADIYASLIARRVMREHGYVTHYGPPFVWSAQERSDESIRQDAELERDGLANVLRFAERLEEITYDKTSILAMASTTYWLQCDQPWQQAALAWILDCQEAMA